MSIEEIKVRLKTYSCDVVKNVKCNKNNCYIMQKAYCECKRTTNFEYAKRTPWNYIKRIINISLGE